MEEKNITDFEERSIGKDKMCRFISLRKRNKKKIIVTVAEVNA